MLQSKRSQHCFIMTGGQSCPKLQRSGDNLPCSYQDCDIFHGCSKSQWRRQICRLSIATNQCLVKFPSDLGPLMVDLDCEFGWAEKGWGLERLLSGESTNCSLRGPGFNSQFQHGSSISRWSRDLFWPCRHQAWMWYTYIHAGKTLIHIKWNEMKIICCQSSSQRYWYQCLDFCL